MLTTPDNFLSSTCLWLPLKKLGGKDLQRGNQVYFCSCRAALPYFTSSLPN